MNDMVKKEFIKVVLVLCIIAIISGALIGGVYSVTKIDAEQQTLDLIADNFPSLSGITKYERSGSTISATVNLDYAAQGRVDGVYTATDGTYIIKSAGKGGYGGEVVLLTAIKDNVIQKILVFSAGETPGIGSNALPPVTGYIGQFEGASVADIEAFEKGSAAAGSVKVWFDSAVSADSGEVQPSSDGKVVTVTGATKSSTAVLNAINMAVRCYKSITEA